MRLLRLRIPMNVADFDFTLPEELIALRPARPRDSARLLHVAPDAPFEDRAVCDLPALLRPGDVLVFNDTRVIHAALAGVRPARGDDGQDVNVQVNLHKRVDARSWRAFARPGKRLRPGDRISFDAGLDAELMEKGEGGDLLLRFDASGPDLDAAIGRAGRAPLPPYIADRRAPDSHDEADYQTIFAARDGSVAAPTAGLHFTPALLQRLDDLGIERHCVTLHVGAGTFLPVKTDNPDDHVMHAEWREVPGAVADAVNAARASGRRIIAIGTTALRTLESAVDAASTLRAVAGETDIFIRPGFPFRICDGLWTNFHLPRSTLFMLVCAFAGTGRMQGAYAHAIGQRYRFYSYGDASLLWRAHG